MIEILGLLGGAVTRLFPAVMGFFKEGRDLKYELLRMDKEVALENLRATNREHEITLSSQAAIDSSWAGGLVEALKSQTQITGDKWLDRINVSVRPILTYWWCIVLYTANKTILTIVAFQEGVALSAFSPIIYTEFDRAIVGSIIGFWFVDRALRKPYDKPSY